MRRSSPPSVLSSIVKGGVRLGLSTLSSLAMISMSPVAIFGFLLERSATVPFTCITYSRPSLLARSHSSASTSLLNTICVMPYRSRRSTKVMPPILRVRCTQPAKVTTSPAFSRRSSPLVFVLYIFLLEIIVVCYSCLYRAASRAIACTTGYSRRNQFTKLQYYWHNW